MLEPAASKVADSAACALQECSEGVEVACDQLSGEEDAKLAWLARQEVPTFMPTGAAPAAAAPAPSPPLPPLAPAMHLQIHAHLKSMWAASEQHRTSLNNWMVTLRRLTLMNLTLPLPLTLALTLTP